MPNLNNRTRLRPSWLCEINGFPFTSNKLNSFKLNSFKQNSPRCDAAERGVPSGAILFAYRIFIEKLNKI